MGTTCKGYNASVRVADGHCKVLVRAQPVRIASICPAATWQQILTARLYHWRRPTITVKQGGDGCIPAVTAAEPIASCSHREPPIVSQARWCGCGGGGRLSTMVTGSPQHRGKVFHRNISARAINRFSETRKRSVCLSLPSARRTAAASDDAAELQTVLLF